jgi:N-acetylmuramoyl-L-alanine amidase
MALNLRESDINLDVSYGLSALLEGAGATVVMTRTDTQAAKINQAPYTVCNKAGATIVISVHTNSVNDPDPNGLLVFYSKRADMSLAQALHDAMYSALERLAPDPASFIDFGVRRFGAGVLRRSTMPASLVEPLFMSNPGEANLLITPIYTAPGSGVFNPGCPAFNCRRGQIAQAIYRGVLTYFGIAAS